MLTSRAGSTLVELLVAMVMLGIIGAAASSALVQQGRVRTRVAARLAAETQLREALAPLMADLGAASPAAGDLEAGNARDSVLELRTTAAEGYACAVDSAAARELHLVALSSQRGRTAAAGDSVWVYSGGAWHASGVERIDRVLPAPSCPPSEDPDGRMALVTAASRIPAAAGAPLRFTRRHRYSLYKAGDGQTYLGLREWNASAGAYAGVQPVAGPFDPVGSRLAWLDSTGAELTSAATGADVSAVAIDLLASRTRTGGYAGGAAARVTLRVALRNRR